MFDREKTTGKLKTHSFCVRPNTKKINQDSLSEMPLFKIIIANKS